MNKIQETCDKLGIGIPRSMDVNPLRVALDHFWDGKARDHRGSAINLCLEKRASFWSECNTSFELMRRLIRIECPVCGKEMKHSGAGGGGDSHSSSTSWACNKCKVEVSLMIGHEGSVSASRTRRKHDEVHQVVYQVPPGCLCSRADRV